MVGVRDRRPEACTRNGSVGSRMGIDLTRRPIRTYIGSDKSQSGSRHDRRRSLRQNSRGTIAGTVREPGSPDSLQRVGTPYQIRAGCGIARARHPHWCRSDRGRARRKPAVPVRPQRSSPIPGTQGSHIQGLGCTQPPPRRTSRSRERDRRRDHLRVGRNRNRARRQRPRFFCCRHGRLFRHHATDTLDRRAFGEKSATSIFRCKLCDGSNLAAKILDTCHAFRLEGLCARR